jgi:hypothetical protein
MRRLFFSGAGRMVLVIPPKDETRRLQHARAATSLGATMTDDLIREAETYKRKVRRYRQWRRDPDAKERSLAQLRTYYASRRDAGRRSRVLGRLNPSPNTCPRHS